MAFRKFLLNLKNSQIITRNLTIRAAPLCSSSKGAELSEATHTGQVSRHIVKAIVGFFL